MPIGTGATILGSSLIGAGSSYFGGKKANEFTGANIDAANRGIYESLDPAHDYRKRGAGEMIGGIETARGGYSESISPYASKAPGLWGEMLDTRNIGAPQQWQNISGSPDEVMANFYASPDYNFRMKEGLDAVQSSAAAGGAGLYSGNALRGVTDYASNLAAGEFGDYINRQMDIGGLEYGRNVDNYGRTAGVTGAAMDADRDLRNMNYASDRDIGAVGAGVYDARAEDILGAGRAYASNLTGQPYVNPYEGMNNAVQGGIQNYMWADAAGMMDPSGGAGTRPQYDFQGRPISYSPQPGPQPYGGRKPSPGMTMPGRMS